MALNFPNSPNEGDKYSDQGSFWTYRNGRWVRGGVEAALAVPVGAVINWTGTTPPYGWLECNGGAVTSDFPELRQHLLDQGSPWGDDGSGNPLRPPAQGYTVRGWDNGAGVDPGRVFGSLQEDAFQGHYHQVRRRNGQVPGDASKSGTGNGASMRGWSDNEIAARDIYTDDIGGYGVPRVANETRGKNIALMLIIRALPAQDVSPVAGAIREFHDPTGTASWQIIGNKLECWGEVVTDGTSNATVLFPKKFARKPSVSAIEEANVTGAATSLFANATTPVTDGFECFTFATDTKQGLPGATIRWHAVGQWDGIS